MSLTLLWLFNATLLDVPGLLLDRAIVLRSRVPVKLQVCLRLHACQRGIVHNVGEDIDDACSGVEYIADDCKDVA